jgi:PTS system N-acetylglucosamine-specific IIC component
MRSPFEALQSLGRALMLPIAVLPAAGLLLRLGQPDLLNIPLLAAAGDAIFSNLGVLFAAGVAVGLARDNHGAAGLAGVVAFLVTTNAAQVLMHVPPDALKGMAGDAADLARVSFKTKAIGKLGVPIGIVSGLVGGTFYNRFSNLKLPDYLAFFGGRRFVPIAAGVAGAAMALIVGLAYGAISDAMDAASRGIVGSGDLGLFLYGAANRLLIITGLHHILNNIAWFIVGDFHGATGDLKRFFAGDPSAGAFMTGFFPVMMFGLPAACLAMYHTAAPDRRKATGGLLLSMALTSFLTGVTEPVEFSFIFLAPALYGLHAALTGASFVVMRALDVKLGFGFSAGLFDYVLNFGKATHPLLLLPVGAAYAGVYYGVFRWAIVRFDLKTPGREAEAPAPAAATASPALPRGEAFVLALGGAANLVSVDACTTRLRLVLEAAGAVDEAALRALGARGIVRPSPTTLQVVLGPQADLVAEEIRNAQKGAGVVRKPSTIDTPRPDAPAWRAALGGPENIADVTLCGSRLLVQARDPARIDDAALMALGARAVARPSDRTVHIILGRDAQRTAALLASPVEWAQAAEQPPSSQARTASTPLSR